MGGHGEEAGFGAVGGIGVVAGLGQRALGFGAVGDVAADALHFRRLARVRSNQALAPGDPARPERRCDLLVVNPGAVGFDRRVALLEDGRCETAAEQRAARPRDQFAIGVVDEGDAALGVAQHDQIALGFEQAAGALLGFLQFPIAVGQRFIVQGDLAQPSCASSAAGCSAWRARRRRSRTGNSRRWQKRGGHSRNSAIGFRR